MTQWFHLLQLFKFGLANTNHEITIGKTNIMKKLITVAVITVVGFLAFHASAKPGMLEIINFNLVYQPQGNDTYTTNTSGTILNNILGETSPSISVPSRIS